MDLYIDGVIDASGDSEVITGSSTTGTAIAGGYSGSAAFGGELDDVGVWERALTHFQIFELFSIGFSTGGTISADLSM